jgi:heme/copper-type cytochrome/quinol oxidase subunit 1
VVSVRGRRADGVDRPHARQRGHGWTFYAPLSSTYTDSTVVWVIVGAFLAGFSSILTGLNFIVTIHKMRAPG